MKILLDEMYPPGLASALRRYGIETSMVADQGLAGRPDVDVLAAAATDGYVLLTENVSDFSRLAAELLAAGGHHSGVMIALSSRFSRRPNGNPYLASVVATFPDEAVLDRIIYLDR